MTDKLAEEIIEKKLKGAVFYGAKDGIDGRQLVINAMQAYHEAKLKEITDVDIEAWANGIANPESKKDFERGEWLGIKEGAKAVLSGEIKHIEG
jgi:hypothetical protein